MVRRDEASTSEQETTRQAAEHGSHKVKARTFSGEGDLVKNLILFVGGMVTILGSFWLMASYPNSVWLFLLGIVVYSVALFVPTTVTSGSTTKHAPGGAEITLDLPSGPHQVAQRPGVPNGAQVNH